MASFNCTIRFIRRVLTTTQEQVFLTGVGDVEDELAAFTSVLPSGMDLVRELVHPFVDVYTLSVVDVIDEVEQHTHLTIRRTTRSFYLNKTLTGRFTLSRSFGCLRTNLTKDCRCLRTVSRSTLSLYHRIHRASVPTKLRHYQND